MTGRQKIQKVLQKIQSEIEISPNPKRVGFHFNTLVMGSGILPDRVEKNILVKLAKKGALEICYPNIEKNELQILGKEEDSIRLIEDEDEVLLKISSNFGIISFYYNLLSYTDNKWNYLNPFWLIWQFIKSAWLLINYFWKKSKLLTGLFGIIGTLLVYDWSSAWKNLKIILKFLKIL